jgi:hypothetical protein
MPAVQDADKPEGISRRRWLYAIGGVIGAAVVIGIVAAAAMGSKNRPPKPKAAPFPRGGRQYASDMRTTFNFGTSVSKRDLAKFGKQVCQDLGSGINVAEEVPSTQAQWSNTSAGDAIQMITLAVQDMCPSQQTPQTVTYVVSGSGVSDVSYGPSGSNYTGSEPMSVTRPLANPSYYAISAQLQGYGGDVRCKLEVDGVTISSASATGGYNIANCEIDQNPTTNSWENLNSG